MNTVCDNPVCENHVAVPNGQHHRNTIRLIVNFKEVAITRFLYRTYGSDMYLCGVCHSAVRMSKRR